MPISVLQDLDGLQLTTRRGVTIKGLVQWDGTAPRPANPGRITTTQAESTGNPLGADPTFTYLDTESGTIRDDDRFEMGGIVGNILFSGGAASWQIKSVTFSGRDITYTGVDAATLTGNDPVVVTFTDKFTNVTGSVEDVRHRPVSNYAVVLLPAEAMTGAAAQRFTRLLLPNQTGGFSVRGLPPGDYVAAAVAPLESGSEWNPAVQKAVRSTGHRFSLSEGQSVSLTLEVVP
jgi:hypothetical protein